MIQPRGLLATAPSTGLPPCRLYRGGLVTQGGWWVCLLDQPAGSIGVVVVLETNLLKLREMGEWTQVSWLIHSPSRINPINKSSLGIYWGFSTISYIISFNPHISSVGSSMIMLTPLSRYENCHSARYRNVCKTKPGSSSPILPDLKILFSTWVKKSGSHLDFPS